MDGGHSWQELPAELLGLVVRKLSFDDRLKIRQVCRTWRQILDQEKVSRASNSLSGMFTPGGWLLCWPCDRCATHVALCRKRVSGTRVRASTSLDWPSKDPTTLGRSCAGCRAFRRRSGGLLCLLCPTARCYLPFSS